MWGAACRDCQGARENTRKQRGREGKTQSGWERRTQTHTRTHTQECRYTNRHTKRAERETVTQKERVRSETCRDREILRGRHPERERETQRGREDKKETHPPRERREVLG